MCFSSSGSSSSRPSSLHFNQPDLSYSISRSLHSSCPASCHSGSCFPIASCSHPWSSQPGGPGSCSRSGQGDLSLYASKEFLLPQSAITIIAPLAPSKAIGLPLFPQASHFSSGIMAFGRGTLIAKFGIESAHHIVPVDPDDRFLLGMQWRGNFFFDLALPFGLRSAPYIFTAIADLLEWTVKCNYRVDFLEHYLDDFHTLDSPDSSQFKHNLATCIKLLSDWGAPLHPDKLEGPSVVMTVIGIELDSLALQARLAQENFDCITGLLDEWSPKRHCKCRITVTLPPGSLATRESRHE